MTNAELIAKIKAEIEILRAGTSEFNYQNAVGYNWALDDVYSFLYNIESERPVQEGLEKEIEKVWETCEPVDEGMGVETANIHIEQFDYLARHFAKWGAEHLKK